MTTPRVTELPRRLEPVGGDTFLAGDEPAPRPLAVVLPFRAPTGRPRSRSRRNDRALHVVVPGDAA
jgi:hypothetical protein